MHFSTKAGRAGAHQAPSRPFPLLRRSAILSICAGAAALAFASQGMAQLLPGPSPEVTEHALPNLLAGPCEIEFDGNGKAWIEEITGNAISRFDPQTGSFTRFPLAQPLAVPGGIEVGPDGAIWFPQLTTNVITRLDPSNGSMQNYPIPYGQLVTGPVTAGVAVASDMATGKDNAVWFSMSGTNAVGRIDVATKQIEIIPLPTPLSTVVVLTQIIQPGPGNTMVMSLGEANKIATIDVFTRQITEYVVPTPVALPQGVTTDRNGDIWFTETAAQKLGRLNVSTGVITEYNILTLRGQLPISLTLGNPLPFPGPIREGSDSKIYFAQGGFQGGNKIGQFDPSTNVYKEFVVPTPLAGICDVNNSQNGEIWFGEFTGNSIGKLRIGN